MAFNSTTRQEELGQIKNKHKDQKAAEYARIAS
jgi:hypothetical protein